RLDLLNTIKSLEKLGKEESSGNLFESYLKSVHSLVLKLNSLVGSTQFKASEIDVDGQLYGSDVRRILSKAQTLSGYGSAIGKLKDFEVIDGFDEVAALIDKIEISNDGESTVYNLLKTLDTIRLKAKKIGNAQRRYMHFLFRELFNKGGDSFLDLDKSIDSAYQKYQIELG
ncbi:MAG: hypothetical protein ACPGSB_01440, partial [Opitutales bacterium]